MSTPFSCNVAYHVSFSVLIALFALSAGILGAKMWSTKKHEMLSFVDIEEATARFDRIDGAEQPLYKIIPSIQNPRQARIGSAWSIIDILTIIASIMSAVLALYFASSYGMWSCVSNAPPSCMRKLVGEVIFDK